MSAPGDIFLSAMQNAVNALRDISKTINGTLSTQVTGVSTSATIGTATLTSSQPAGFLTLLSSAGTTIKVAYYNE